MIVVVQLSLTLSSANISKPDELNPLVPVVAGKK